MKVIPTIHALRAELAAARGRERTIGLVPTMGYLHEGHLTLAGRARRDNDVVVASIFVNPIQFGPGEDYESYPRDLDRDVSLLAAAGVDVVFAPPVREIYPTPPKTFVEVPHIGSLLEGAVRPAYFRGVATVVSKLFNIVQPTRAYFGEKDYQQVMVIRQMVADLSFPVEIVPVPTVRESDGLALSSRNVYLTPEERRASLRLSQALAEAQAMVRRGVESPAALEAHLRRYIAEEPLARIDLVAVRDADTIEETGDRLPGRVLVLLFVRFGKAQLLDHVVIDRGDPAAEGLRATGG
ncbi:pantoate--beta-alanine ligase [Arenibaculum sp.]|jgi:pantoate--beta-alanine ligase|uniref:pantoate--beta-alanine ligase n=1 Tax=Arenibaculum sp. TaxID=2865862 RepID=UPI002E15C0D6|nr:pantoate--beta-alanine ligase [Arenibaculum sp.]